MIHIFGPKLSKCYSRKPGFLFFLNILNYVDVFVIYKSKNFKNLNMIQFLWIEHNSILYLALWSASF